MKITNIDLKFFTSKISQLSNRCHTHESIKSDGYFKIESFSADLIVSIGNYNRVHINRLEDDYFRVWMEFLKKTEIKNSSLRNFVSKTKPKNKIKTYHFEDCRKDLICDNREGVIKSMQDFGLFENLT